MVSQEPQRRQLCDIPSPPKETQSKQLEHRLQFHEPCQSTPTQMRDLPDFCTSKPTPAPPDFVAGSSNCARYRASFALRRPKWYSVAYLYGHEYFNVVLTMVMVEESHCEGGKSPCSSELYGRCGLAVICKKKPNRTYSSPSPLQVWNVMLIAIQQGGKGACSPSISLICTLLPFEEYPVSTKICVGAPFLRHPCSWTFNIER